MSPRRISPSTGGDRERLVVAVAAKTSANAKDAGGWPHRRGWKQRNDVFEDDVRFGKSRTRLFLVTAKSFVGGAGA